MLWSSQRCFITSSKFLKFSNTLSSKTVLNYSSIDVIAATYSKLSNPFSLNDLEKSIFFKFIDGKYLRTFKTLFSILNFIVLLRLFLNKSLHMDPLEVNFNA